MNQTKIRSNIADLTPESSIPFAKLPSAGVKTQQLLVFKNFVKTSD